MSVNISSAAGVAAQLFTNTGTVLTGGKLYTYLAGTTTPAVTYTTSSGGTAQPNPIVLDSAGRVPGGEIWLTDNVSYKFVLKTSTDVLIATYDNITGIGNVFLSTLAASTGSSLIGYLPAGTGAISTTVQAKLREIVSVKDFGAVGDGTTDDTAAIQAAINYITNTTFATTWPAGTKNYDKGGGVVVIPPGRYRITSGLLLGQHVRLQGSSTKGFFYPYGAQNTGSVILADFTNPNQWIISSANYNVSGAKIGYRDNTSGAEMDAGTWNFTHGIEVKDLMLKAVSSCYGGIRLNGSPNSVLENVGAYGTDVGFLVNASWGVTARNMFCVSYLYGFAAIADVNGLDLNGYFDCYSGKTVDSTNRLTGLTVNDFNSTIGFATDFSNKKMGVVSYYTNTLNMDNVVSEHWEVACIHVNTTGLSNNSLYTEGNTLTVFASAVCLGVLNGLFSYNPSLTGDPYSFGYNNNLTMAGIPKLGYAGGNDTYNSIRIENSKPDAYGWKYTDWMVFVGAPTGVIRVAAAGSVDNIAYDSTYTTLDEALRRIIASPLRDWEIIVKDGDIVQNTNVIELIDKNITFTKEGSGSACSLIFNVITGVVKRWDLLGNVTLRFNKVDIGYTTSTTPTDPYISSGLFIKQGDASNISIGFNDCTIALQTAYSVFQQGFNSSANIMSSFNTCTITGSSTASIMSPASGNSAYTNVVNSAYGNTVPASVKAFGTNGWQNANVIASNF